MHSQTRGERRELLYIATGNPEGHGNRQGRAIRARGTSEKSWHTHLSHQKEVENHLVILLLRSDMESYVSICPSIHLTTEFGTDTAQTPPPAHYHPYFQVSPLFPPRSLWGFPCPAVCPHHFCPSPQHASACPLEPRPSQHCPGTTSCSLREARRN